jgi:hypothetical protein
MALEPMETRRFSDDDGLMWEAFAADAIVAHGKQGAVLAFRPADAEPLEELRSTITFNSLPAAEFALKTLGEKELRRRLSLARMAVGGV